MPQISVVIPSYNYATVLTRAVESVTRQPGEAFEVLIVDDGSTDETEQVARLLVTYFLTESLFTSLILMHAEQDE